MPEHIMVAFDASPLSLLALQAAAELAQRWQARLAGIYVEDENLVRLAMHPLAPVVSMQDGRQLGVGLVSPALKVRQKEAERRFLAELARHRVAGAFQSRQGLVADELLAAARGADLVVLGWHGCAPHERLRLGDVARRLAERSDRPVLLMRRAFADDCPIAVPAGDAACAAAAAGLAHHRPIREVSRAEEAGPNSLLVSRHLTDLFVARGSVLMLPSALNHSDGSVH